LLSEITESEINKNPQGFIQVLRGAPLGITAGNPPKNMYPHPALFRRLHPKSLSRGRGT